MDIWRCGVVAQPIESLLRNGLQQAAVHWLPEQPAGQFLADPFGWPMGSALHVFVERFDYRTRHGVIDRLTLDDSGRVMESRPALREAWHLSYPLVFEGEGATWMLPESFRGERLTLYRGDAALDNWRSELPIELDRVPVDATPLWHAGRWWMFYSPADTKLTRFSHLHVAWAERLAGPWHAHPRNPVRVDASSSRPGGRAVVVDGRILLPVQDCSRTYGGGIRPLWIDRLDERTFEASAGAVLSLPATAGVYGDGMHTLSGSGAWTVFDVKRVDRSGRGWWFDLQRWLQASA